MSKNSRLLAIVLGCSLLLVAGCASASGSTHPPGHHPKLVRTPWGPIARGRDSRTLLLRTLDVCYHYTTRVVKQTSRVIRIELLEPDPEAQPFASCPANAVRGSFFVVPVHLKAPYRGQRLVDPVTGFSHRLIPRSDLYLN
ncbi:MAG: hypothetical protein M3Y17_09325 [Actinomycetota bacterium]|nr:hypothetical protein [Actinomycetota bacterium]